MDSYLIEIPIDNDEKMDKFQELMDKVHDEIVKYIENLASELGVSYGCASDVWYLRTRARWTQELENRLIELHRSGDPPKNMGDFG